MSDKPKNCKNCMYSEFSEDAGRGTCHRFPPKDTVRERGPNCRFTIVDEDNWCGEFKPKG